VRISGQYLCRKNGFTKVFINLTRYRSEINFVWTIKIIRYDAQAWWAMLQTILTF